MTKQEFLTSLQETLAAEMNGQQVMDQVLLLQRLY